MKDTALRFTIRYHRIAILLAIVALMLLVGAAGEVAAHNPAGVDVAGCHNGADAAASHNPNCHG
ncbi:hypothetical protein [Halalkalicoccus jeotgali]|uniref:Uncharacterized protein n=1 Tax=Halalkalicoccus jeotgali (strain DSM 18796 / CECT 7217 / JCM 14584 / KCTC 4019 / B3) TaxID=795797 RepID=D8JA05_HALJB|nr:hypothetical protein [Halalkalicoccus jeotgali]ADJ14527.1 hypothetical protein HacjB3_05680 [Halalkalicoccus jeotgali B3]ELY40099.1 hypothetical protein C497_04045 [Halalkalicoccus jeotgali B3]